MKSDVGSPEPQGDWTEDAITKIDPRGPRAARHRNLLRACLLFHSNVLWDNKTREHWKLLTGKDEASTRTLCDAIREAGLNIDDMMR